jgi:vacuolar protein sorting-associated protein VTA1
LDLSHIWGEPEAEITAKTKYAKFHALRIAKAIKAGEDPNLSNPKREPSPTPEETLDPNDLEVQLIAGTPPPIRGRVRTASVEDVPDEHYSLQPSMAAQSNIDQSLHPSRAPSLPRPTDPHTTNFMPTPPDLSTGENYYQRQHRDTGDVSPMEASPERKDYEGGGYFSNPPQFASEDFRQSTGTSLAKSPVMLRGLAGADHQGAPNPPNPSQQQQPSYSTFAPVAHQPPSESNTRRVPFFPQAAPISPPPMQQSPSYTTYPTEHPQQPLPPPPQSYYYPPQQPSAPQPPPQAPSYQHVPIEQDHLIYDEEAIAKAQKHARWAISALNFEDVKTAVKELRGALESLGAK